MGAVINISSLEQAHVAEMQDNLSRELHQIHEADRRVYGDLRDTALRLVADENYEEATEAIKGYVAAQSSFPIYQSRAERHVQHCLDLIQALKTKRNFPGMASLSLAKQQELYEKALEHFNELKHSLNHLQRLEREQKLTDVRSTVWVIRALTLSVGAIMTTAFFLEVRNGMFNTFMALTEHYSNVLSIWLVNLFHL